MFRAVTSAVNVYLRVDRYTSPQAAYRLGISY
jgi:hypothetical protein